MISYNVVFWAGLGLVFVGLIVPMLMWREAQKGVMFTSLTTLAGYLTMRVSGGLKLGAEVPPVVSVQLEGVGGISTLTDIAVVVALTALCWRSSRLQYELDLRKPQKQSFLVQTIKLVNGLRRRPPIAKQPNRRTG
jgi:hypothetical protein